MRTCDYCGGIIGRDCFNPNECARITLEMERRTECEPEPPVGPDDEPPTTEESA